MIGRRVARGIEARMTGETLINTVDADHTPPHLTHAAYSEAHYRPGIHRSAPSGACRRRRSQHTLALHHWVAPRDLCRVEQILAARFIVTVDRRVRYHNPNTSRGAHESRSVSRVSSAPRSLRLGSVGPRLR
jgi:hypothetical protein